MIRLSEHGNITSRNNSSVGFNVESLLAPASTAISQTTTKTTTTCNSSTKLTAKVQPFEVKENDLMESSNPRPENAFPKGHPSSIPTLFPSLGYPSFPSPTALANFQLYSLWSHAHAGAAGLFNWPLLANPLFTQSAATSRLSNSVDTSLNNPSRNQTNGKQQSNEDASLSSSSATESLLAASECHLAVLQDDDGDTPLHIAIVQKNKRLIQKLIGLISFSKLTVNSRNHLSQTALHLAVLTKQPMVVQQLMDAGADANAQDRNGQTAIHLSAANGDIESLTEILNAKSKASKLDLEIKNFDGLTALHVAVQKKHKDISEVLIQHGANMNAKDGKSGHTPLHHAIDQECCEVLQLLVANGANINKPNYSGVSPVQNANCCRNDAISKIILSQETVPTTTTPTKSKTTTTSTSTMSTSPINVTNTVKDGENNKPEMQKRKLQSSPSISKRAKIEVAK